MIRCPYCGGILRQSTVTHQGVSYTASQCATCGKSVMTEAQWGEAALKLRSVRLRKSYLKRTFKVGHSLAITLPKDIVDALALEPGTELTLVPHPVDRTIELRA